MTGIDPRTPVLIGVGQITDTTGAPSSARSRVAFCAEAAQAALADTGANPSEVARGIDTVAVMEFFSDISPRFQSPFGRSSNPAASVAKRIGAAPRRNYYAHSGGNMPQYLVNRFAEEISRGECRAALIGGAELMRSTQNARKAGLALDWNEDPGGEPERIGDPRAGFTPEEARHGLRAAIHYYPLIENAIRAGHGRSVDTHMTAMGGLFEKLAAVARANPRASRRKGYSAEALATPSDENRWICFPYPRLMNANAMIDQAAAVLLTSVGQAEAWGVPRAKWVFLRGCADGTDIWAVSERAALDRSPAIAGCARVALGMAGVSAREIESFDLYSCFPSAVEVAMREIGIADDDPRPISITGGLPFFGGPGNNYVTHAIAEMVERVRARPGKLGMVTANGMYLTKHSVGIYSTDPSSAPFRREPPARLQAELDAGPKLRVETAPRGSGRIETYCVAFGLEAPEQAFAFGRLDGSGARFVAVAPREPALLAALMTGDQLGRPVEVGPEDGKNVFRPL